MASGLGEGGCKAPTFLSSPHGPPGLGREGSGHVGTLLGAADLESFTCMNSSPWRKPCLEKYTVTGPDQHLRPSRPGWGLLESPGRPQGVGLCRQRVGTLSTSLLHSRGRFSSPHHDHIEPPQSLSITSPSFTSFTTPITAWMLSQVHQLLSLMECKPGPEQCWHMEKQPSLFAEWHQPRNLLGKLRRVERRFSRHLAQISTPRVSKLKSLNMRPLYNLRIFFQSPHESSYILISINLRLENKATRASVLLESKIIFYKSWHLHAFE